MILTITPNPSIDISYKFNDFKINGINRTDKIIKTAGGKGLNVARVLKILGADVFVTGFIGGDFGNFIIKELKKINIQSDFVNTNINTRCCIAILENSNQTEILEISDEILSIYEDEFFKKFKNLLKDINVLSISGSLPKGISKDFYKKVVDITKENNLKLVIDTSNEILIDLIKSKKEIFAIKPNIEEICQVYNFFKNEKVDYNYIMENDIKDFLKDDIFSNINLIIVSNGKKGALFKFDDKFYKVVIPKVVAKNPVGSGDASIAGLCYGLDNNYNIFDSVKISMTCGVLNALEDMTGYININNFKKINEQILIEEI